MISRMPVFDELVNYKSVPHSSHRLFPVVDSLIYRTFGKNSSKSSTAFALLVHLTLQRKECQQMLRMMSMSSS